MMQLPVGKPYAGNADRHSGKQLPECVKGKKSAENVCSAVHPPSPERRFVSCAEKRALTDIAEEETEGKSNGEQIHSRRLEADYG